MRPKLWHSFTSARQESGRSTHAQQPQPLRSDDFPDGLQRVDSANASYKAIAELLEMLIGWDISVSIENPANSLFWKTSWIERLLKLFPKGHNTILDHCMHGGSRDKASKFWSYNPLRPDENMLESLFGRYIALAVPLNCNSVHTLIASLPKGAKPTSRAVHRGFFQGCSLGHLRKSNDHTTRSSSWTRLRGNNGWGAQEPHRVHGSCAEGWSPEGAFGQNFSRCCKSH